MLKPGSNARRKAPWSWLLTPGACVLCSTWSLAGDGIPPSQPARSDFPPEYSVVRFTTEDGLPQHEISALSQSHDGYLWIGTWFGLARYDGVRFVVFDRFETPSLPSNTINAICEDSRNTLWIGSGLGITSVQGTNAVGFTNIAGRALGNVTCLIPARSGGIWAGCDAGIVRLGGDGPAQFVVETPANSSPFVTLMELGGDRLVVCNRNEWLELDPGTRRLQRPATEMSPGNAASVVAFDPINGRHWCAIGNELLLKTDVSWERKFAPESNETLDFARLHVDSQGGLWAVIRPWGLMMWDGKSFVRPRVDEPDLLHRANCILGDREGSLWVGSSDGLIRLHRRQAVTFSNQHGLSDDSAWSVAEAPDGAIWVGTEHGLNAIKDGIVKVHYTNEPLSRREVRTVLVDRTGDVWFAREKVNLFRYTPGKTPVPVDAAGVAGRTIGALYEDIERSIWVGTSEGVVRLRGGLPAPVPGLEAVAGRDVRSILRDRAGDVWFGTAEAGLWRLRNGNAKHFGSDHGLSTDSVWALHEDADGDLWVGTEHGLNRMRNGEISRFTTRHGLVENLINQILEDQSGYLWLSGLRGIYRVHRADLAKVAAGTLSTVPCMTLNAEDGLESSETNGESQPAGCRSSDGRLWFPTTRGVAVIDPRNVRENRTAPPVVIERVTVKGHLAFGDGLAHGLPWKGAASMTIPSGGGEQLEIAYTAPTFIQSRKVQFRYRLRGHDTGWRDADDRRLAVYPKLKPGPYTFEVMAANSHGHWGSTSIDVPIRVAPRFFETVSFRLYGLAAITALGIIAYRSRLKTQRHHLLAEIAALERERTRIAKDLHDDVGANLTGLALQAEIVSRDLSGSVELRRHLTSFVQESRALVDRMREVIWAVNPECDSFESLVHYLTHHTETYLGTGGLLCRLDLPDSLPPRYIRAEVRHQLLLVLKEALANTVKHSGAREVRVRIAMEGNRLVLAIRDNGHGFEESEPGSVRRNGSGHGLVNMRDRIHGIGGSFEFHTRAGEGTEITVEVPLNATFAPNSARRPTRTTIAIGEDLHAFRNGKQSPTPL